MERFVLGCDHSTVSFDFQANYNELNPDDRDYRFYANLALDRQVRTAIDLGCGTGTLARLLATHGIDVVAVDPDPEMLRVARSIDPPAEPAGRVEWRLGDSRDLGAEMADFAVMSGHVAQVFTDDESWMSTLNDLHRALTPGGTLAFESRNPNARKWEGWTRARTLKTISTAEGDVEFWHETVSAELPLVVYDTYTRNLQTRDQHANRDVLAFRGESHLRTSLQDSGFEVTDVLGTWDGRPADQDTPELIMIARRT